MSVCYRYKAQDKTHINIGNEFQIWAKCVPQLFMLFYEILLVPGHRGPHECDR